MKKANQTMTTKKLLSIIIMVSCLYGCGTLGGWKNRTFPVPEGELSGAIDSLFKYSHQYKIPDKWKQEDSSMMNAYSFLKSRSFYFKEAPEEMYYVAFVEYADQPDPTKSILAVRAINRGGSKWYKIEDISSKEITRIQKRFDQVIISKLEEYLSVPVIKEEEQ